MVIQNCFFEFFNLEKNLDMLYNYSQSTDSSEYEFLLLTPKALSIQSLTKFKDRFHPNIPWIPFKSFFVDLACSPFLQFLTQSKFSTKKRVFLSGLISLTAKKKNSAKFFFTSTSLVNSFNKGEQTVFSSIYFFIFLLLKT